MSDVGAMLRFDALAEAEKIIGASYKTDPGTEHLGMFLHIAHGRAKADALMAAGDSWFSMNLADTLELYARLGFVEVLCDEFTGKGWGRDPDPVETFRILWREDGVLATVESHNTTGRNMTEVYYNVRPHGDRIPWDVTSSGHYADGVWVGDHDAREGISFKLARLAAAGDFLPVWTECPFLWFVTYSESEVDGYDYKAITEARIARLPERVRNAIGGAR